VGAVLASRRPEHPAVTNPLFVPALRWPLPLAGGAGRAAL
jgi:hypothetical protein